MAKLSQLTKVLSDATAIPVSSVNVIARVLREEGYIATGPRGPGAVMGERDVASLILAVCAGGQHLKAASDVRRVGAQSLKRIEYSSEWVQYDLPPHDSFGLQKGNSLFDVLVNILKLYELDCEMVKFYNYPQIKHINSFEESMYELMKLKTVKVDDHKLDSQKIVAIDLSVERRGDDYTSNLDILDNYGNKFKVRFVSDGCNGNYESYIVDDRLIFNGNIKGYSTSVAVGAVVLDNLVRCIRRRAQ